MEEMNAQQTFECDPSRPQEHSIYPFSGLIVAKNMPSNSKNNKMASLVGNPNSTVRTATARHMWTYKQQLLVRVLLVEYLHERALIEKQDRKVISDIFAELNLNARVFKWSDFAALERNQTTKDQQRAWRSGDWQGQAYPQEDRELMIELREGINESAAFKRYRAEVKERTGSDGEDCGILEGDDAVAEEAIDQDGDDDSDVTMK
ncbi:hypothetical protein CLAFUW4_10736 [Fulvia fulva]|uniref:Uncharacterized protein n=1 Tax=Passalora fulva TaxID=5499 RepID=A0A9Q8LFU9_PASFU|nr:uncharacterized protein CLAFUR5_05349 [Fulvia fulva]KAK4615947.1 hypothetical protein CLAFUR4_10741 [Fulvia fulva]KAK4617059.1 hypothetical protein CLAFUR0_10748 [Fulvia fulva]UJO16821.1 hypothetical protein CLAFUR5_05349 [Fulvia fulva]WPV19385.1 hypothetical protein CLAFUW4_10736 [Fulvia fulva]WPV34369.1 hypothetical protein CLAFUW7_10738 [Fulvia fulva]